jgi:phage terminase large subunit GpA-like protein
MYASAREVRLGIAEMIRPARRVSVSESAAKNLKVVNPSGSSSLNMDVSPYMREPVDLVRSRQFEAIVFVGPARSGKTIWLVDGVTAYSIVDDPADTLIIQTNQSQAEDFSKTRISRGIAGSPELAQRLSPRAHDDNVLLKFFRNGMALRFGWPTLAQLSGKDLRRVLMTDVDNITGDLSIDECFGLALKRTQTYMSAGILVAESSPARDYAEPKWRPRSAHEAPPADGILSLYNRGDRRRWYWPCPECKEPFQAAPGIDGFALPSFEELLERVLVDDVLVMAEQHARLGCPNCGVALEHRWKRQMNRAARWVGEGQTMRADGTVTGEGVRSRTASFYVGGVAAAYQTWASLVERYLQAVKHYAQTGETKPLKTTVNVDQAAPFIPPAVQAGQAGHELQERAEDLPQGEVPLGVRFLTGQIDIQAGKNARFVVQVHGVGVGRERWIIDRYALKSSARIGPDGNPLPINPAGYVEDWARLIDKVIARRYLLADGSGRSMPVRIVVCDSGGEDGVTQRAYEFWRSLKGTGLQGRFRLLKGSDSAGKLVEETFPDARGRKDRKSGAAGDVPVLRLSATQLKDAVMADVRRSTPGPGYYHFPKWLPTSFYDELTAEVRTAKLWDNPSKRKNETFDLCYYGHGAELQLRADRINWSAPPSWAAEWDKNPDVIVAAEGVQPVVPIRRVLRNSRSSYLSR